MLTTQERESIAEGFRAAGERISPLEQDLEQLKKQQDELFGQTQKQMRRLLNIYGEHLRAPESRGNRFWPSDEMAKEFGDLFLVAAHKKAAGEAVGYEGGYLISEEIAGWIIERMGSYGKFRANTMVIPLKSQTMIVPEVQTDLTIYAPGEGNEITESDMKFSQVKLVMKKLVALAKVSSELEEDSVIAVGEIVGLSMARSMAKKEDQIGFVGNGTEAYFGMTGITGALRGVDATIGNIAGLQVASGNAWSEITLDNFEDLEARLPDDADNGAKWYVNRKFYFAVMHRLVRAAGVANFFELLSPKRERYFDHCPVEFVSAMPAVEGNSQICAILGDLSLGSYLGQRKNLTIDRSKEVYFANDQIGFRGVERIDINCYGVGDTSEAGPIVGLITAAS